MNWYYAVAAERKGPVVQAEFDRLVLQGDITVEMLVWHEGMTDWKPFGEVNQPSITAPPANGIVCSGCRSIFPQADVVSLGGSFYCAACKPAAVQRMQEGVAPNAGSAEAIRNEHLKHEASVKSVGFLYCLGGVGVTLAGLSLTIVGFASGQGESLGTAVLGVFFLLLGVGQFLVGRGLRKLRPWTRTPTTILSCLGLLGFPLGTLINAYILYLVLSAKGRMVLSEEYNQVVAQTPHIKYRTSIVVWVVLVAIVVLFIAMVLFFSPTTPARR